jgi:hypothetical protein
LHWIRRSAAATAYSINSYWGKGYQKVYLTGNICDGPRRDLPETNEIGVVMSGGGLVATARRLINSNGRRVSHNAFG